MIDVARLDVMSICGHGPWANFLRGERTTYRTGDIGNRPGYTGTGQCPCLHRVRSLCSPAARFNGPNFPDILAYGALFRRGKRTVSGRVRYRIERKMKNTAHDKRHARLRCTSSVKIDCAYNCRKYTPRCPFSLDPSFLPRSVLCASLRAYLRSRKTLKANARPTSREDRGWKRRAEHACEKGGRLNEFISSCELQRWADDKYHVHLFLAGPRPYRGRIASKFIQITTLTSRTTGVDGWLNSLIRLSTRRANN